MTAGTIGAVVSDIESGEMMVLSNNHVFANGTMLQKPGASVGDAILQPAWLDAGSPVDTVATLERWVPLDLEGDNLVDCALARPVSEGMFVPLVVGDAGPDGTLRCIAVKGTVAARGGETVHNTGGRPVTRAGIIDADFTTCIKYSGADPLVFVGKIPACIKVDGRFRPLTGRPGPGNRARGCVCKGRRGVLRNREQNPERRGHAWHRVPDVRTIYIYPGFDAVGDPVGAVSGVPSLVWVAAGVILGAVVSRR